MVRVGRSIFIRKSFRLIQRWEAQNLQTMPSQAGFRATLRVGDLPLAML